MTIQLPDDLYERLHADLERSGAIPDEFIECAIINYLALGEYARTAMPKLNSDGTRDVPFAALGSSGFTDTAENIEEILWEGIGRAGNR